MTPRPIPAIRPRGACRTFLLALLAVFAVAATVHAGSVAVLDQDGGLPNAPIGAPLKAFNGLRQVEDTGRWLSYTRESDQLEVFGIPVKGITYNFFKERLYSINLDIVGKRNTKQLLRTLEQRYGTDHSFDTQSYPKISATMEIREWKGTKLYCVYKSSSEYEGGVLTLLDRPTWDQLQVPKNEKAAQSKEMLKGSFMNGDF